MATDDKLDAINPSNWARVEVLPQLESQRVEFKKKSMGQTKKPGDEN